MPMRRYRSVEDRNTRIMIGALVIGTIILVVWATHAIILQQTKTPTGRSLGIPSDHPTGCTLDPPSVP
jgi:hypothetical protein